MVMQKLVTRALVLIEKSKDVNGSNPYYYLLMMDSCIRLMWELTITHVQFTKGDKILKYLNKLNKMSDKLVLGNGRRKVKPTEWVRKC